METAEGAGFTRVPAGVAELAELPGLRDEAGLRPSGPVRHPDPLTL